MVEGEKCLTKEGFLVGSFLSEEVLRVQVAGIGFRVGVGESFPLQIVD